MNFFGRRNNAASLAPAAAAPSAESAPEQMAEALRMLELREAHLDRLIASEVDAARKHSAANNKSEALQAIKRKKVHEKERERLSGQKINLIQQEHMLQAVRFNGIILNATQAGSAAIERELKRVGGVEGAERVQDRMEDCLADVSDLLDVSARPMGEAASLDDDALLEELEAMDASRQAEEEDAEQAALERELRAVTGVAPNRGASSQPTALPLPVPVTQPLFATLPARTASAKEREEERELAELAARMTMEQPMPAPMQACF